MLVSRENEGSSTAIHWDPNRWVGGGFLSPIYIADANGEVEQEP